MAFSSFNWGPGWIAVGFLGYRFDALLSYGSIECVPELSKGC